MRKIALRLIKRYEVAWAVVTVLLYFAAIPATVWLFPEINTLGLSLLVLFSGFTASMTALASVLKQDQDE